MYPNASTEPLCVIEANECNAHHGSLATARFQSCFNEIERLRALLADIERICMTAAANLTIAAEDRKLYALIGHGIAAEAPSPERLHRKDGGGDHE